MMAPPARIASLPALHSGHWSTHGDDRLCRGTSKRSIQVDKLAPGHQFDTPDGT